MENIYLNNEHRDMLQEMCNYLLPNKIRKRPCIYKVEYDKVVCKYDSYNNYGSQIGLGIHWFQMIILHLSNKLKLEPDDLIKFIEISKLYSDDNNLTHPIKYIYQIFEKLKRTNKINTVLL